MTRLHKLRPGFIRGEISVAYPLRIARDAHANYWYFHSNKLNNLLLIESDVLFASIVILEFLPEVLSYDGVPMATSDDAPDPAADLEVRFEDRHTELWCCRRNTPPVNWRPIMPDGTKCRLITGQDIENRRCQFDNALMLSGAITAALNYDCAPACNALLMIFVAKATATVEEVLSIPGYDSALLRAALGELLADGTLVADLESQLLSPESIIKRSEGRSASQKAALPGRLMDEATDRTEPSSQQNISKEDASELLPRGRRRLIPLEYINAEWPTPGDHEIADRNKPLYKWRKAIVDAYRRGKTYKKITRRLHVSEGEVRRLVSRCVTPVMGGIYGYYALVPWLHMEREMDGTADNEKAAHDKKAPLGSGSHQWTRLLRQVEGLTSFIKGNVLRGEVPREGRDLDIDDIHQRVLECLEKAGFHKTEDYPFTNVDQGRDAVARYVRKLAHGHLLRFTRIYYGESAEKRARHIGRGLRRIIRPCRPGSFV